MSDRSTTTPAERAEARRHRRDLRELERTGIDLAAIPASVHLERLTP